MYNSIDDFMNVVKNKNHNEIEFHQAVHEVIESIWVKRPAAEAVIKR